MTEPAAKNPLPFVLPWVVAGLLLFAFAALAGFGAAYIMATANAAPSVDPSRLPTPTPVLTGTPIPTTAGPGVSATTSSTPSPTAMATVTLPAEPSATPTAAGPTPTPISYVVQRGDRLSSIAAQFGVTVEAIVELNKIKNPDHIEVGQILLIPLP